MICTPFERNSKLLVLGVAVAFTSFADGRNLRVEARVPARVATPARLAQSSTPGKTIIIAIDGLNPRYVDLNASASGAGAPGDWLMPNVRAFVKEQATHWPNARGFFPHATDMNHLNVLAGTHSGLTGIVSVNVQPETWTSSGLTRGKVHLGKARYPNGTPVQTLFDLLPNALGRPGVRAFVSSKNWVPEQYLEGYGREASIEIIANGRTYPAYVRPPRYLSFHDNPFSDPDAGCDPESFSQVSVLDAASRADPGDHPRDFWVAEAALGILAREQPDMIYILLADLDHFQHSFGAVDDPNEWVLRGNWNLPPGCDDRLRYHLVSSRNNRLFKEPILDGIRDVDLAFANLMAGLEAGGHLNGSTVVLVSDHGMINHLARDNIVNDTNIQQKLADAGLAPDDYFLAAAASTFQMLYWRPIVKAFYPNLVATARDELRSARHVAYNPQTRNLEMPWEVLDRWDMIVGRPDLGIGPMEFFNAYFAAQDQWPDLIVVARNGWQIPLIRSDGSAVLLFNAGHGGPETAEVMVAIRGLGFPAGTTCAEPATLADVGRTIADSWGQAFPMTIGVPLTCTPNLP